jgi:hypothetical protein
MEDFNLRKYLAEGKMLNEEITLEEEIKNLTESEQTLILKQKSEDFVSKYGKIKLNINHE